MTNEQFLEQVKIEIQSLAAETFALQALVAQLANRIGSTSPALATAVLQSFDEAANLVEQFSIARGKDAGHITKSLKVIEELRVAVAGKPDPKRGI